MTRRTTAFAFACLALVGGLVTGCAETAPDEITPPHVPALSEADRESQAAIDLEGWRENYLGMYPDVEVPSVARIRFIDGTEWADVIAECLTDAGFPTVSAGGGISASPPSGQEVAWGLAAYSCNAQYPVDPQQTRPLNDDQLRYIYEYYTLKAVPCLKELGYTDVGDIPSLQTFIDTYDSADGWMPYSLLEVPSEEEWTELNKKCPQTPEGLYG